MIICDFVFDIKMILKIFFINKIVINKKNIEIIFFNITFTLIVIT